VLYETLAILQQVESDGQVLVIGHRWCRGTDAHYIHSRILCGGLVGTSGSVNSQTLNTDGSLSECRHWASSCGGTYFSFSRDSHAFFHARRELSYRSRASTLVDEHGIYAYSDAELTLSINDVADVHSSDRYTRTANA
jgi:hypothetical protein